MSQFQPIVPDFTTVDSQKIPLRPLFELDKGTLVAVDFSLDAALPDSGRKIEAIVKVLGARASGLDDRAFLCVCLGPEELADVHFPLDLARACARIGVTPASLCLFFTDAACLALGMLSLEQFLKFKRLGFRLGLDIAAIATLPALLVERLPADVLRLDVLDSMPVENDPESERNIADFVSFASNLLMLPAAKGVHDSLQLNHLKNMGIRIGQGPLFSDSIQYAPL